MQKAGEICQTCKPFWDKQKKKPKRLRLLPNTTENHESPVVVCPYCDGPAWRFAQRAEARAKEDS